MDQNNNKYNLNFFGNVNAHIFFNKAKNQRIYTYSQNPSIVQTSCKALMFHNSVLEVCKPLDIFQEKIESEFSWECAMIVCCELLFN